MMLFLLPRRIPMLALIATNLVISMPAPPSKPRSPEDGFSSVPKILEIQLPLKIATKDDLVAWARYVMGLMASKINITLTTVKEAPSKAGNAVSRYPGPPTGMRSSTFQSLDSGKPVNGVRQFANPKSFESARYAENVRNFATNLANLEKTIPAAVRILENSGRQPESVRIVDNGRQSVENSVELPRNQQRNGNLQSFKDKVYATAQYPSINGVTTKSLFNNLQVQPTFSGFGITDTTVPSPLEITANINVPKTRIKEPVFVKSPFDSPSLLKTSEQQLFVPPFPEFGPAVTIDVKPTTVFRNTNVVSPPTRAYLPVPTTSDNIKFPNDPFVTRYFFDGIERNVSSNFGADEITFTTQNPPVIFNDELSSALRGVDFLSQQRNVSSAKPLFKLPFEAVITFTREEPVQTTTLKSEASKYFTIPTRDPPDQFPPYFDTSNFTVTNESGQINVVFDDGTQVTENTSGSKKEERKKQEKKKDSSKKEKSKKQKLETKRRPSAISQLLRTFIAIRRNNTPSTNLSPPPFNQQTSTTTTTTTTTTQRAPVRQRIPPPQKTQLYSTERPSSVSRQKGRRNQTSLAQQVEDDDDDSSGSKEEGNDSKEEDSKEESGSKEDSGGKSEENGNDDVESEEGNNSDDESSSESESSEEEEGGGSINAIIELLMLAAPALEDLSDPDSDADIVDLLELAVPLLQDLSEGDDENEASDVPALVLPALMQLSEGPDGPRDSAAILTPLLQVIAPVIGPLSGPLLVPLSRQSSNAPGEGGSSVGDLSNASLGPLLEPIGPGKMTRLSNLIATVVSSLSKNSGHGGKSDLTSLVKAVVAGSVAGTSAGSSGSSSSSGHKDTYGAPTGYGNSYDGSPRPNGYPKPPVHSNSDQLGSSINQILNAIFKVVASLVNAISTVLNASSKTFIETGSPPAHGTRPKYGAPPKYSAPPRYRAPPKHGAPARNKVPLSETISITTSEPGQLIRE